MRMFRIRSHKRNHSISNKIGNNSYRIHKREKKHHHLCKINLHFFVSPREIKRERKKDDVPFQVK